MIGNKILEQESKAFFKELHSLLLGSDEEKQAICAGIRESMDEYLDVHPDASMEDVIKRIGTPEEIANSDQYSMGEVAVRQKIRRKKWIAFVIGLVIFALGILALIFIAIYFTKASNELPTYYEASEEVIDTKSSNSEDFWNDSNNDVIV